MSSLICQILLVSALFSTFSTAAPIPDLRQLVGKRLTVAATVSGTGNPTSQALGLNAAQDSSNDLGKILPIVRGRDLTPLGQTAPINMGGIDFPAEVSDFADGLLIPRDIPTAESTNPTSAQTPDPASATSTNIIISGVSHTLSIPPTGAPGPICVPERFPFCTPDTSSIPLPPNAGLTSATAANAGTLAVAYYLAPTSASMPPLVPIQQSEAGDLNNGGLKIGDTIVSLDNHPRSASNTEQSPPALALKDGDSNLNTGGLKIADVVMSSNNHPHTASKGELPSHDDDGRAEGDTRIPDVTSDVVLPPAEW
ncbi:hypothetical protein H0H93_007371 [Arthromyces matolae]|nr:hypothetical protein H0H93_007371 [Arthromyces matolae]